MAKLRFISLFAGLIAFAAFAQLAKADPITDISGLHNFTLSSDGNTATITFIGGSTTVANGMLVGPYTTNFSNPVFSIDSNTLIVNSFPVVGAKEVDTGTGTPGVFDFLSATISFPQSNVGIINGTEILAQNTNDPNFDLSLFANGGVFTFSINAPMNTNIQQIIQGGGQLISTGSFSQMANPIPEPTTLAVFGLAGIAGSWYLRKRAKQRIS